MTDFFVVKKLSYKSSDKDFTRFYKIENKYELNEYDPIKVRRKEEENEKKQEKKRKELNTGKVCKRKNVNQIRKKGDIPMLLPFILYCF